MPPVLRQGAIRLRRVAIGQGDGDDRVAVLVVHDVDPAGLVAYWQGR